MVDGGEGAVCGRGQPLAERLAVVGQLSGAEAALPLLTVKGG